MQSLNEELTTVNAELNSKLDDLSQSNDDMQNLLNSTDIATVFLDNELKSNGSPSRSKSWSDYCQPTWDARLRTSRSSCGTISSWTIAAKCSDRSSFGNAKCKRTRASGT